VRQALASGQDVIMRVDVQGAATVRRLCPEALLIFLTTQNEQELESRLMARRTESAEELILRIATARQEMQRLGEFDYVVVNRDNHLKDAVANILAILDAEHSRVEQRQVAL
jgi:guanylate kinase